MRERTLKKSLKIYYQFKIASFNLKEHFKGTVILQVQSYNYTYSIAYYYIFA